MSSLFGWIVGPLLTVSMIVAPAAALAEPTPDSGPGYVGSSACKTCHAEQYRSWLGSHHDLAMQAATDATVLGDFGGRVFEHRGVRSRFFRDGPRFMVETQGADGAQHVYEVGFTFGVAPLQQYLVGFPDGRYQALTVAWDSRPAEAGGQRWFSLYPDEDVPPGDELHWLSSAHNWNFACAECHSTNLRKGYDSAQDRYATTWSEIDVGCEACHGPASRHVELAEAAGRGESAAYPADHGLVVQLAPGATWSAAEGSDTAVRTSAAKGASQLELCGRCHARRSQLSEDYRHGAPLSDSHRVALLEDGLYFPDGQMLDEVYVYGSFRQSRMHAAGVTCSDCHEPHSLKIRRAGNALCTACHKAEAYDSSRHHFHPAGGDGSACVDCHMPARTYMVVDPRRDHSFRIPRPDLAASLGVPDVCSGCHKGRSAAWAAQQIRQWYGADRREGFQTYAAAFAAARADQADAPERLAALAVDPAAPAIARATALGALGAHLGPGSIQAVVNGLYAEDALERRAAVEALARLDRDTRWKLLVPLLADPVRGVRIAVAVALSDVRVAELEAADRPRLQRVFDEYLAAERLNADRAEHWVNLAGFHARQGMIDESERAFGEALRRDPGYLPAYVNQADLLRTLDREADAERVLRAGIAARPNAASLHHALGLLMIRTGRTEAAMESLKTAYEFAPEAPRFGYVYGVALDSTGAAPQALKVWEAVAGRHPNDRDSLQALAVGLHRQGLNEQALGYAERLRQLLPGNRSVVELIETIRADQTQR